jgi:hypothetical protein
VKTPEAKIKSVITTILRRHEAYYFLPVQTGRGASTLDYLGIHKSRGFAIEAKRPGGKLTERQIGTIENIERAGGKTFVIDGPDGFKALEDWLTA